MSRTHQPRIWNGSVLLFSRRKGRRLEIITTSSENMNGLTLKFWEITILTSPIWELKQQFSYYRNKWQFPWSHPHNIAAHPKEQMIWWTPIPPLCSQRNVQAGKTPTSPSISATKVTIGLSKYRHVWFLFVWRPNDWESLIFNRVTMR